jgi:hypothetical protein
VRCGVWLYPWDLFDHGPQRVADELAAAGSSDVFLALSYHSVQALLPDNPRRTFFDAPRAAVYFDPDPALWDGQDVRPVRSALLDREGDAAEAARDACAAAGLRLAAWTVCLHDSTLAQRHPDLAVRDVWGGRASRSVCVLNPGTRAFAATLVHDVARRVDAVQLEAAHWTTPHAVHAKLDAPQPELFRRLTACCVCVHCLRECADYGADPDRLRDQLRSAGAAALREVEGSVVPECAVDDYLATNVDDFAAYQQCRQGAVTSLVSELTTRSGGKPVEFVSYGDRRITACDLAAIHSVPADVRVLAYGDAQTVTKTVDAMDGSIRHSGRFGVGLSALPSDARDEAALRASTEAAVASGAASIAFYNYGMLGARRRGWLARAISDVAGRSPA